MRNSRGLTMRVIRAIGFSAVLSIGSAVLAGQAPFGLLMGQVVDAKGSGVAGAMLILDGGLEALGSSITAAPLAGGPRRTMTAADGQFVFFGLPKGSYSLDVAKMGYLSGAYGRKRYGGAAQSIRLGDGEHQTQIRITLWEYAAISGRIQDEAGEPLVGVKVRALPRILESGRWRLDSVAGTNLDDDTDDRGEYRIDGLAPGDYVIAVVSTQLTVPVAFLASTQQAAGRTGNGGTVLASTTSGWFLVSAPRTAPANPPASAAREMLVYPTMFYPGARSTTEAEVVTLASGEERLGMNVQLVPVVSTTVSGTVVWPAQALPGASVKLLPEDEGSLTTDRGFEAAGTTVDGQGRFTFLGVPPGRYILRSVNAIADIDTSGRREFSASLPLTVDESGASNVVLTMRGGVLVSGRVAFDGTLPKPGPEVMQRFFVRMEPTEPFVHRSQTAYRASVNSTGSFQIPDVPPGKYIVKFQASALDRRAMDGWESVGANLGGRDVSTRPMDLQVDTSGIVLTLSDHAGRLSGTARDRSGRVDADACVLLFTTERDLWMDSGVTNRRIRSVRASDDGTFVFPVVHAGTYFLAAIPEEDAAHWDDPKVLERIALSAQRVLFGESERKTQDITTRPIR